MRKRLRRFPPPTRTDDCCGCHEHLVAITDRLRQEIAVDEAMDHSLYFLVFTAGGNRHQTRRGVVDPSDYLAFTSLLNAEFLMSPANIACRR
jgi:hypothetical protein